MLTLSLILLFVFYSRKNRASDLNRKSSSALVRISPGTGNILINGKVLFNYVQNNPNCFLRCLTQLVYILFVWVTIMFIEVT